MSNPPVLCLHCGRRPEPEAGEDHSPDGCTRKGAPISEQSHTVKALAAQLREAHQALFEIWLTTSQQMSAVDKARAALNAAVAFLEGGQS